MTTYIYTLPTTGYGLFHTHTRDGVASTATIFWTDCNTADEALERLAREVDSLQRYAPRNVLHDLRLVYHNGRNEKARDIERVTVVGKGPALR